jgi:hypothetical protein
MEELFVSFWWLIFPVFGMVYGLVAMINGERQSRALMDMIKSYVDQGKEPPAELMKALSASMEEAGVSTQTKPAQGGDTKGWSIVVFAAVATGAGVAYYLSQHYIFLAVAAGMGVMAAGVLVMLLLGRGK